MRHILACLVVLSGASFNVSAQQPPASDRLAAGVEAGVALATLSAYQSPNVDEAFDTSFRTGVTAGAFVDWALRDRLSFRTAIDFVQKGAVLEFADGRGSDLASVEIRYVELAPLFRLSFSRNPAQPFVNLGPTFAFKTSATVDASASGGSSNVDVGSQVRDADVGIAIGGGVQYERWSAEARFVQGIIDIGNTLAVSDVVRTRTVSFLAGLRF